MTYRELKEKLKEKLKGKHHELLVDFVDELMRR